MKRIICIGALLCLFLDYTASAQETWVSAGLSGKNVLSLLPAQDGMLYAGLESGGVVQGDGSVWMPFENGLPDQSTILALCQAPSGSMYAVTRDTIFRYNGSAWQSVNNGLSLGVQIVALTWDSAGALYAGVDSSAVYKNTGAGWIPMSRGLPDTARISVLSYNHRTKRLVAGTDYSGVWEYRDSVWVDISNNFIRARVTSMSVSKTGAVVAGMVLYGVAIYDNGVWDSVNTGITQLFGFYSKAQAMYHSETDTLYLGTDSGVYCLVNGKWVKIKGLTGNGADVNAITEYKGKLYSSSYGGVFRREYGSGISDTHDFVRSPGVLPNPVDEVSTVSYSVDRGADVDLSVYDIRGRQVLSLFRVHREPGEYVERIDATSLPPGVYYLRLRIGDRLRLMPLRVIH